MVFLLNYMPWLIVALVFWLCAKSFKKPKRFWTILLLGVLALIVLNALQPSYLPKGEASRTQLEQFEAEELQMQDNLRKPEELSQYRHERIEARKEYVEKVKP